MPVIVVTSRDGVQTYVLEEGKPLFLGRATECDIVLPSTAVSRRHAVILFKNGICGVKDLGSFNGTILNGNIIQEPQQLSDKDVLHISVYVIRLHTKDPALSASEDSRQPGEPREVHFESDTFENSALPLPRAMLRQRELNRDMQGIPANSANDRHDTQAFSPGRDTSEFIRAASEQHAKEVVEQEQEDSSGYFKPFPIPETGEMKAVGPDDPTLSENPAPQDLADFEESPLSPLENIGGVEEKELTPFLASAENFDAAAEFVSALQSDAEALIPLGDAYHTNMAGLSSEAEAIIPLIDDTPLVTSLHRDLLDEDADGEPETGEYQKLDPDEDAAPDTAEYTLPPITDEAESVPETGDYLIENVPDVATPPEGMIPTTGDTDSLEAVAADDQTEDQADDEPDEFGIRPSSSDTNRTVANIGQVGSSQSSLKGKSALSGVASITISSTFMAAINTRLSLYSLLYDLVEERKRFRGQNPGLPEDVEAELERQDQELNNLPTAEEAEQQMTILRERSEQLDQAIQQAEEAGVEGPPPPTPEMLAAEDFAVTQWLLISDSNRQALPAIYREAYSLAAEEPLAKELSSARISHGRMMGGAVYLLALESLATMANNERFRLARKIRKLSEGAEEEEGFFGRLGKFAENIMNRNQIKDEIARLEAEDRMNEIRAELANREARFMEKSMAREFRQVYKKAALRYIPDFTTMPLSVRAFLRHGVIGFSPWWMSKEAREYIHRDCTDNVIPEFSHGPGDINVLYADEYLYAVSQMDCTPSPDEELLASSLNSSEWKTDRAFRRIVNARSYNVLMEEMMGQLDLTGKYLHEEAINIEKRINAIKDRGFSGGDHMFELQSELQQFQSRRENISRNIKRIQEELIPSILEAIEDAERRFRTGDLRIPDQETLIRREVDAMFRIGRNLEGENERFMPMVVREQYRFKSDIVNDRGAVRSILVKMEELDPNIFMRTIIPSKHKRNRVDLRMSPTILIYPAAGRSCMCSLGREGMESGHLVVPSCFIKSGLRSKQITHMLADFRWETSRVEAGRDLIKSSTLAGVFAKLRWTCRQQPKNRREKQMLFTDISEKENWRRIYEIYLPDALNGGRLLFQRNAELYEAIIGKYIDPPEGVKILRRGV